MRYYSELDIKNRYFTSAYPQGNRQAEVVNNVIINGLKKRLDEAKALKSSFSLFVIINFFPYLAPM